MIMALYMVFLAFAAFVMLLLCIVFCQEVGKGMPEREEPAAYSRPRRRRVQVYEIGYGRRQYCMHR